MLKQRKKWLVSLCTLMLLSTILTTTGSAFAKYKFNPLLPQADTLEIIIEEDVEGV